MKNEEDRQNEPGSRLSRGLGLVERGNRWLKRPSDQRKMLLLKKLRNIPATIAAIPFYFGKSSILNVYLTYHPDSHSCFNNHSEFYTLFDKFIDHNKVNNAGDTVRLWSFILNIKQVISENIEGDFAELGVWRGTQEEAICCR